MLFIKLNFEWMEFLLSDRMPWDVGCEHILVCRKEKKRNSYPGNCGCPVSLELLDELDLVYGKREETVMTRIGCHFLDGDYEKALVAATDFPDKSKREYYSVMEEIYKEMEENGEEGLDKLYLEAAEVYPDWLHMQLSAGIVQLKQKQYNSAKRYFERAYYIDYDSGMAMVKEQVIDSIEEWKEIKMENKLADFLLKMDIKNGGKVAEKLVGGYSKAVDITSYIGDVKEIGEL